MDKHFAVFYVNLHVLLIIIINIFVACIKEWTMRVGKGFFREP